MWVKDEGYWWVTRQVGVEEEYDGLRVLVHS